VYQSLTNEYLVLTKRIKIFGKTSETMEKFCSKISVTGSSGVVLERTMVVAETTASFWKDSVTGVQIMNVYQKLCIMLNESLIICHKVLILLTTSSFPVFLPSLT
jgi:hypothetical protein